MRASHLGLSVRDLERSLRFYATCFRFDPERLINKLKAWRGIVIPGYDKSPESYLAGLHRCASVIWIKAHTRTTVDHIGFGSGRR